jgi:isopentenyl-diphosphate Delta-isomerase
VSPREAKLVELVDDAGRHAGVATVTAAHQAPGQLHRAFSVLLVDADGRLLLQQRAAGKTRFAMCWANACCGHPEPDEVPADAAARRTAEELGVDGIALTEIGVYVYRAEDPESGRVEHEYDHVLVGRLGADSRLVPDPTEVAAIDWCDPAWLAKELAAGPRRYAPWLAGVVDVWQESIRQ